MALVAAKYKKLVVVFDMREFFLLLTRKKDI
jgi:hypothetical protein